MRRLRRKAALAAAAITLAGAGIAYLASNGVSPSSTGEGSGTVSVTANSGTVSYPSTIHMP